MNILAAMIAVMRVTSELADTLNSTGNVAADTLIRATVSVVSTRLIDSEVPCDWDKVKDALELETTRNKELQPRVSEITCMASQVKQLQKTANASIYVKMSSAFLEVCASEMIKYRV